MNSKQIALLGVLAFSVLISGLLTDIRFDDEVRHFWMPQDWYELGKRPLYLTLVDTDIEQGRLRYYVKAPSWHFGLMLIWKIWGGVSKTIAQLYHTAFYVLLIFGTYLLAKEMYGKEAGWYAAVVTATIPMFVAFGIMFLMDMPIAALVPFGLYFIVKKRYLWAGVLMGLMFITKRNSYLLFPTFFLFTLRGKSLPVISRLKNCLIFCVLVLAITLPDFMFRYKNFGGLIQSGDKGRVVQFAGASFKKAVSASIDKVLSRESSPISSPAKKWINFLPSDIRKPINIPKYLGLCLLVLLGIYFFRFRRLYQKQDLLLAFPVIVYLPLYAIFFKNAWAMRYLGPILPLVAILAAKVFTTDKGKKFSHLIIGLCLLQFVATLVYVSINRTIKPGEREMLDYSREEVSADARMMTAEASFVAYYTGRHTLWQSSFTASDFNRLFWGADYSEIKQILDKYKISHLLIFKRRIYDDERGRESSGYPKSFVNKLPGADFVEKVFENDYVAIWQKNK